MLILLNNPAGISVIPVPTNVLVNILVVLVAELVLMLLNNSAGIDVIPVHPENVPKNIEFVLVAELVSIPLNNPAGISVIPVPSNVPEKRGIPLIAVPSDLNIAPNEPDIDATFVLVVPENDIAELAADEYPVAVPLKRIVCSPADAHVHVYVVEKVADVRLMVLPEIVPYDDVF